MFEKAGNKFKLIFVVVSMILVLLYLVASQGGEREEK